MMGGDITVESAPGSGSTFLLRLPAEVAGPGETAEVRAAVASPRVEGCNLILVVDDDETMRDLMDRFLSKEGFTVAKASGGREALQLAHELRPDAITLDVMMPDLDGWTVLAAIKGDPELADTPVILMTILDEKTRGFALGAAEFMVKPVDRERLATTLKKLCSSAGRRVLVVDDDKFVRDDVQRSLEREGWQVTQAENGQIALARLAESRPDIIVLDLMMPEMDGFEFLAALRDRPEWHEIPVLVVTARDLTAEDRARLTGGVKRIIPKGTSSRDEVLREVARLLRASVKRDELPEMESTT
jgi:CheY-like chemotaxis protein